MYSVDQWVNWYIGNGPTRPKIPYDPTTQTAVNAMSPSNWVSYDAAKARADKVAFVLTDDDPYFCIDLDRCYDLETGKWSGLSTDILSAFPGAYVEVSQSGLGLHIIGRGIVPAGYKTRGDGVELYHTNRFIAITGGNARGNPDIDFTNVLATVVPRYLERRTDDAIDISKWTNEPVEGCVPIADDDLLIERMCGSRASARVVFGGKVHPRDLWAGNVSVLAASWPSATDEFDRSRADAALASHLAFWTGQDCERMERLMRRSALVRDKWDRRGDNYLRRTILGVVGGQTKTYSASPTPVVTDKNVLVREGYQYLDIFQQHKLFEGCVHIVKGRKVLTPRGILTPDEFNDVYSKHLFQMDLSEGSKPSKNAYECLTRSRATEFPSADNMCFRPEIPPVTIVQEGNRTLVNVYNPANVVLGEGDVSPFLEFMEALIPAETDREILISYMAALRQYPGVKFQWCPLIQGVEGNGKSLVLSVAEYAVGPQYTHRPSSKELGDSGAKFTGWLANKLLVLVEEIYVSDRREVSDALKPLITDRRIEIQSKGADQVTYDNRANFILTSNHRDAILKTRDDRRYAVFYTAQQSREDIKRCGMGGLYFPRMYNWLRGGGYADVAGYLDRYDIPDRWNPATECHRAPRTSSTLAAIAESRGPLEQEILAAVEEQRRGFRGGWISSIALVNLLREIGRRTSPQKREEILGSLGYVRHPSLANGQASRIILQDDGKRPKLFIHENHADIHIADGTAVTDAYVSAQEEG